MACWCGVYAFWKGPFFEHVVPTDDETEKVFRALGVPRRSVVVGRVAGWGRVVEHTKGWRATQAYPVSLAVACATCLGLGTFRRADWVQRWQRSYDPQSVCDDHAPDPWDGRLADVRFPAREVESELIARYAVNRGDMPTH